MTESSPSLDIHADLARRLLTDFLKTEIERAGFSRGVVGVSGGVDSALSCFLAADALGPDFSARAFHAQVLGEGPLPLDILAERIGAWIDAR